MEIQLKERFINLSQERKNRIVDVCMGEFISNGYDRTSTNTIVAKLEIAKGSFFKYFGSKENLYLYLIQEIYRESAEVQGDPNYYQKSDLFDRLDEILDYSMSFCREHPQKYKLILEAELNTTSSMYNRVLEIKKRFSNDSIWAIYEDVNWDLYSLTREEICTIFLWFVKGVKADLAERISVGLPIDEYESVLQERIKVYKKAIFHGIYKE